MCLSCLTQIQTKYFTYSINRVPNKSNCHPNDTREEVKLRHLDSCDADEDGTRTGNQAHLSILSLFVLCCPTLCFRVHWLLRSLPLISIWQVKAVIHGNHFLLAFLRKLTKGTEVFVFLSFVTPLTLLSLCSS